MKQFKFVFTALSLFVYTFTNMSFKKQEFIKERGLSVAIQNFNAFEKKLITQVSKKLENKGYPLQQVTRVL